MITCPQCGHEALDGARFCDTCGQGLEQAAAPADGLTPLEAGLVLKEGFEIVELISHSSQENRYRASRRTDGQVQWLLLRERLGPSAPQPPQSNAEPPADAAPAPQEDPNGPRAKTAELKAPPGARAGGECAPLAKTADQPAVEPQPEAATLGETMAPHAEGAEAEEPPAPSDGIAPSAAASAAADQEEAEPSAPEGGAAGGEDLGEVFGRVMSLSLTLGHPAFHRALAGFAQNGRVYLVYPERRFTPLASRPGGIVMSEGEAIAAAIQLCQAAAYINQRGLRLNDICPTSIGYGGDGRIEAAELDYVSNDLELQSDPVFNDGYTAPEIYRGKSVDKRADVFSIGGLLYTCLTGERIACESWREEGGPVRFFPPHVISPELEQAVRRAIAFRREERWAGAEALKAELLRLAARLTVRSAALTDVGMVRELNEDSVMALEYRRESVVEPAGKFLYVVSDGMGGAEAGETASAIAVATIRDYFEKQLLAEPPLSGGLGERPAPAAGAAAVQGALEQANRSILDYQAARPELRGMGATGVVLLITPPAAAIAWVGDSRAYLYEAGRLRQLTRDHSLVQRLVEIGQITPEQARHHEHKNVITRSLGARPGGMAGAEALTVRLKRGDRLLLCSDGLTAHLEDHQIGEVLGRHSDPFAAAREFIAAANAGGGTDNISVAVVFID